MAADPLLKNNGRYVPMSLYLEDRRELRGWMGSIASDVTEIRRELDRGGGREVAEEAAQAAVVATRREKREILRDVGLCLLSAAATVAATIGTAQLL